MILLHLRDNQSHEGSIKDMFPSPSGRELLELARGKIREWHYGVLGRVKEQSERLHEEKGDGPDETSTVSEFIAPNVLELAAIIKSSTSVLKDLGDDGDCWTLTVEGVDKPGRTILVFLRLPKGENAILQIVDFQVIS